LGNRGPRRDPGRRSDRSRQVAPWPRHGAVLHLALAASQAESGSGRRRLQAGATGHDPCPLQCLGIAAPCSPIGGFAAVATPEGYLCLIKHDHVLHGSSSLHTDLPSALIMSRGV
jgi:hypothetical protein